MKQKVEGQCENCGNDYELQSEVENGVEISCPFCKKVTENWDTPDSPQMAPSIVVIKNKSV